MRGRITTLSFVALGSLALLLGSHVGGDIATSTFSNASRPDEMGHAEGTAVDVDIVRGRITLKHDAIDGLGMPAMTTVFRAIDPLMLLHFQVGDPVEFTAVRKDNVFIVTQIRSH